MSAAVSALPGLGVFVINLPRSPQRLASIAASLKRLGLPFTRVAGIDGESLGPPPWAGVDEHKYRHQHGKLASPTEVGCYFSHLAAMRVFLASAATYALILEDDARLRDDLVAVLKSALATADSWDILSLFGNHRAAPIVARRLPEGRAIVAYRLPQTGAVAYMINRAAAQICTDRLLPMTLPFDHALARTWETRIRYRGILPQQVGQIGLPTTIRPGSKLPRRMRIYTALFRGATIASWIAHYALRDRVWIPKARVAPRRTEVKA